MKEKRSLIPRGCTVPSLENETHFLSFAVIVATRNGTEGSNIIVAIHIDFEETSKLAPETIVIVPIPDYCHILA